MWRKRRVMASLRSDEDAAAAAAAAVASNNDITASPHT